MFTNFSLLHAVALLCQTLYTLDTAVGIPRRRSFVVNVQRTTGYDIPILTRKMVFEQEFEDEKFFRRGDVEGSIGTGDSGDLLYTVPIELGDKVFSVNIDTGSSDLWVVSDKCQGNSCAGSKVPRYHSEDLVPAGADIDMFYGDSTTGTYASGTIGLETATIAGIAIQGQSFGAVDETNNTVVEFETSGILGLGFPGGSRIQEALVVHKTGPIHSTDNFFLSTYSDGPLLTRIAMTGALQMPMFSISLQRNTIDVSGEGLFTVGKLPDGVDNSSLTWVPVRLYREADGGTPPPSYAPKEVFPYRWEIDIDAVFLDGQKLADSTIPATDGVDSKRVSALIDTGNSILRGPEDVVNRVLTLVSPTYSLKDKNPVAAFPCNVPHSLSFQIGGKLFPIDPRDFVGQYKRGNTTVCQADNLVATDPPSLGALFRWSLGTPFFRSNLVAFHYGNLTHPSVDPPRIGIMTRVPTNAGQLLQASVRNATAHGGEFPNIIEPAPTQSAAVQPKTTVMVPLPIVQAAKDLSSPLIYSSLLLASLSICF